MNRIGSVLAAAACAAALGSNAGIHVVPMPQKVVERPGAHVAPSFSALKVETVRDASIPDEGYRLVVTPEKISVWASGDAGAFYARQTLAQMSDRLPDGGVSVPCAEIEDAPRFKWRGAHIDDCRHFFGKESLKRVIDAMAYHKLNVLHWHLTEDQGWRIEIKKYPKLVQAGAVRPGSPKRKRDVRKGEKGRWINDGRPYGPFFYTQDDVKEIVAYAAARHIKVVPEIELPGHALAALAAYPELGCTGRKLEPWWRWGVSEDILCGGNDKAVKFLEDVLDEVCELFPSDVIHIGGDEAPKTRWKECPKCQKRIKELGLKGEEGLQGWMTRHFTEYLAGKGRRAVGWDEVLDGNPGRDTIVMSWRGTKGGIKAAKRGNDVVMSPTTFCYLDFSPGIKGDDFEYIRYKDPLTLKKVYSFNPTDGIPPEQHGRILGGQGNNWSEYTWTPPELEWKMWPRMSALAEVFWTQPAGKDFESFKARMAPVRDYLRNTLKMNCGPLE